METFDMRGVWLLKWVSFFHAEQTFPFVGDRYPRTSARVRYMWSVCGGGGETGHF